MFGVFLRQTATTYFVLVNKEPFNTGIQYLNRERYYKVPDLKPGVKIEFDETTIKLAEYSDCENCHMPLIGGKECSCPYKDLISATGELINSEFKHYATGMGLKVSMKHGDYDSHAVLFKGDIWFDIMKKMDTGEHITFKAILKNCNGNNNLVKLFHVRIVDNGLNSWNNSI